MIAIERDAVSLNGFNGACSASPPTERGGTHNTRRNLSIKSIQN